MKGISIIGSGNVGRRIGEEFSKTSKVIFYDILEEVIRGLGEKGYDASLDMNYAVGKSDISFVAVPTPLGEDRLYNTSCLKSAARNCGSSLREKDDYHIFVLKSTVIPGTTENLFIPALEENSGKAEGDNFGVIYNPEFLTVIEKTWTGNKDFCITPGKEGRVVLGEGKNKKAGDVVERFYKEQNPSIPVLRTNYETAEMMKLVANNRLALAISFSNEVFLNCEILKEKGMKIDADFVMKAAAMDARIGQYGSVFGKSWGGPCFLKDTVALKRFLEKETSKTPKIIAASIDVNDEMKKKYGVRE